MEHSSEQVQEFYVQVPFTEAMFESRPDLLILWQELQGLSGQPHQISITGKPNQVSLRFDFPSSRQMAQVGYKSVIINAYHKKGS